MVEKVRFVRASQAGWEVADDPQGGLIAVHVRMSTAVDQARRELNGMGGGSLVITDGKGKTSTAQIHPPPPTQWFDLFVPYVLLLLPPFVTSVLGPAAPLLFAPAILSSDGTVIGVALATFVLSVGAAVTVAWAMIRPEDLGGPNIVYIAAGALLIANLVAIVLGTVSLDILAARPDWMPASFGGPIANAIAMVVMFLIAGVLTYGVGGAILALIAGALAGWRFAVWYQNWHDLAAV